MDLIYPLYLASQSPRRHDGLNRYEIPFTVIENQLEIEPSHDGNEPFGDYVMRLSLLKATASKSDYKGLVVGMDTVVICHDQVYGKPLDLRDAKQMLMSFSGYEQTVLSSVTVIDTISDKTISKFEENSVFFNRLTDSMVDEYCDHFEVLDKAGSYGIQDCLGSLISHYEGSFDSILGFPIKSLLQILKECDMIKV